jgi:hypothetical protein
LISRLFSALLTLSLVASLGSAASAGTSKQCRDAQGKFTKCPSPAPSAAATKQCRDAKGKYTKCPSPAPSAAATKKP